MREYAHNYARMREPNWLPTGQISWQQTTAGPTDRRQHEERDINPMSPTYNTIRTIQDGSFPACAPACSGPNQVLRNGVCVTRTKECMGSMVQSGCNTTQNRCFYTNTYRYSYSDGTYSAPYNVTEGFPCNQ